MCSIVCHIFLFLFANFTNCLLHGDVCHSPKYATRKIYSLEHAILHFVCVTLGDDLFLFTWSKDFGIVYFELMTIGGSIPYEQDWLSTVEDDVSALLSIQHSEKIGY